MDKNKETLQTWNKIAQIYEDKFMGLDLYNDSYNIFCELLEAENARILELGCGPGNITKYLLSKKPEWNILGIDIAPNMIELARKNNPSADFKVMDGRNIKTLKIKFDGMIAGFYLPYLSKIERLDLIQECHYLLNEKGIFYLSFVAGNDSQSGYKSGSSGDRVYFYYHNLEDVKKELMENNFRIMKQIDKDYAKGNEVEIHTILIAQKNAQ